MVGEEGEQVYVDAHNVDGERISHVELPVRLHEQSELGHLPLHVGANVGAIVVSIQRTENDAAILDPAVVW